MKNNIIFLQKMSLNYNLKQVWKLKYESEQRIFKLL